MKNIVVNDEYRQSDLKPSTLLEQYIGLLQNDVAALLAKGNLVSSVCPACSSTKSLKQFEKFHLVYKECADCRSLYVALRPSDGDIARFYHEAPSKVFWRNQLSEASGTERNTKIIKPRFEWINDSAAEYVPHAKHWMDIHTGQRRYIEAMAQTAFARKTLVYPYCDVPANSGVHVIDQPWWQIKGAQEADIVTLFEVLDHTSDVNLLLTKIKSMLKDGGLCFLTSILASGFDVKELGAHAKNIYPPDRLNVFSVEGLNKLFTKHSFECLEFSTPGVLDVDIVAAALQEDDTITASAFIRHLVLHASEDVRRAFQEFLQTNLLSSYGRILIRKV